ncbi:MAG: hypothetical protein QGG83_04035 [Candidatus Woesearchaeota archaeon]|nr:hypothetical protein [Candidatus Woesearchaeota archaeon]
MSQILLIAGLLATLGCQHVPEKAPRLEQRILAQETVLGKSITYGVVASTNLQKYNTWTERNAASSNDGHLVFFNLRVLQESAERLFSQGERLQKESKNSRTKLNRLANAARKDELQADAFYQEAGKIRYWNAWKAFYKKHKDSPDKEQWFSHHAKRALLHRELAQISQFPRRIDRLGPHTARKDWHYILRKDPVIAYVKQKNRALVYAGTQTNPEINMPSLALSQMCTHLDRRHWAFGAEEDPQWIGANTLLTQLDKQLKGDRYDAVIQLTQKSEKKQRKLLTQIASQYMALTGI